MSIINKLLTGFGFLLISLVVIKLSVTAYDFLRGPRELKLNEAECLDIHGKATRLGFDSATPFEHGWVFTAGPTKTVVSGPCDIKMKAE
jgi:hypothetical protein